MIYGNPDDLPCRCPSCPARLVQFCRAQADGHDRFCELADPSHPDYSTEYRSWLAEAPAWPNDERREPPPSVASAAIGLLAVKSCPWFEPRTDLG